MEKKNLKVFLYTAFSFLFRLFFVLCFVLSLGASIFLALQTSTNDFIAEYPYYLFAFFALLVIMLSSVYFFALLRILKLKFFHALILGDAFHEKSWFLKDEMKACFKMIASLVVIGAYKLSWALFYLLPALVISGILYYSLSNGGLALNVFYVLAGADICAAIFGVLFTFCTIQRYHLAPKLLSLQNYGVFESIKMSIKKTNGSLSSIAFFRLSFLPWLVICIWVVPLVYVVPYYCISFELLKEKFILNKSEKKVYKTVYVSGTTKKLPQI